MYGSSIMLLWRRFPRKPNSTTTCFFKLPAYTSSCGISQQTSKRSKSSDQPPSTMVHSVMYAAMFNYFSTQESAYGPTKRANHSNLFQKSILCQLVIRISRKMLSSKIGVLQWWMRQIVCKFRLWYDIAPWSWYKNHR